MDTASDFTGCIQTGDDVAATVNDLSIFVDDHAAHGVVTFHRDATGVERSLDDLVDQNAFSTAERIFLGVNSLVVGVDSFFEVVCRDTDLLSQVFNRVGVIECAGLQCSFVFRSFGVLLLFKTISVNDCPSNGFRLVKHGVTQYVASCVFFNEAFAVEVHKQEAVNMREEVRSMFFSRNSARDALDVIQTAGTCTDIDQIG